MNPVIRSKSSSPEGGHKRRRPARIALISILLSLLIAGPLALRHFSRLRSPLAQETRFMMNTFVTISAMGPEAITTPAITGALDRMQEVDAKFSSHNPESEIYAFNRRGVPISDGEIVAVIKRALEIARASGGAFDITVFPLLELWGFYGDSPRLPRDARILACLDRVGYRSIVVKDSRIEKRREGVAIDLGGIAKGYAIAQAVKVLREKGVTSALVDAGGDIFALGKRGDRMWKVGIKNPRKEDLLGYVEAEDLAVMGSGDYERFFEAGGERYHHIIDPGTGYPSRGMSGITMFHLDPMAADAWNTALFVLGPEKGLAIVEKTPGMEAIMTTPSGEIIYSSGLAHGLKRIEQ